MVVERQRHLGAVREVRRDVVGGQLDLSVLHVLGVDEEDVVQEAQLLQEGGADETVEVAAGDQPVGAFWINSGSRHESFVVAAGPELDSGTAARTTGRG